MVLYVENAKIQITLMNHLRRMKSSLIYIHRMYYEKITVRLFVLTLCQLILHNILLSTDLDKRFCKKTCHFLETCRNIQPLLMHCRIRWERG